MRTILIVSAIALSLGLSSSADAQHRHYHHHGGGGNWAGPLVGGLIVGGMLGAMASQPRYYAPPPVVVEPYPYQPVCYRRRVGYDYYGYPVYRTICE